MIKGTPYEAYAFWKNMLDVALYDFLNKPSESGLSVVNAALNDILTEYRAGRLKLITYISSNKEE